MSVSYCPCYTFPARNDCVSMSQIIYFGRSLLSHLIVNVFRSGFKDKEQRSATDHCSAPNSSYSSISPPGYPSLSPFTPATQLLLTWTSVCPSYLSVECYDTLDISSWKTPIITGSIASYTGAMYVCTSTCAGIHHQYAALFSSTLPSGSKDQIRQCQAIYALLGYDLPQSAGQNE